MTIVLKFTTILNAYKYKQQQEQMKIIIIMNLNLRRNKYWRIDVKKIDVRKGTVTTTSNG